MYQRGNNVQAKHAELFPFPTDGAWSSLAAMLFVDTKSLRHIFQCEKQSVKHYLYYITICEKEEKNKILYPS